MTKSTIRGSASALAILLLTQPALADVTAAQVWSDLQEYMTGFGYEISATETRSGDTLTIGDMSMKIDMGPEMPGAVSMSFGGMTLTDQANGTVAVTFPASVPITFDVAVEGEEPVSGKATFAQNGLVATVSGSPDKMNWTYTADDFDLTQDEITIEGKSYGPENFKFAMEFEALSGTSSSTKGNLRKIVQTMTVGKMSYDVDIRPPEENGRATAKGAVNDLTFQGTTEIPEGMNTSDMAAALEAGFAMEGGFAHKGGTNDFAFNDDGDAMSGTSVSSGGTFDLAMNADMIHYRIAGNGVKLDISSGDLPFPVSLTMGESLFNFLVPIGPNEEPEKFAMGITLGEFTMSDMIWGMIDPGQVLPRDPATISFDLTGTAKMLFNLMDAEQMAALENSPSMPVEPHSLKLNSLLIQAAGARIAGDGSFTFDNADTSTFPGMPRPEGSVDLNIRGANGLIDKLVQMGLLPEEQAMGGRMMMSMFAVPGAGEDELNSKIEVNSQGHVLANGQRLR